MVYNYISSDGKRICRFDDEKSITRFNDYCQYYYDKIHEYIPDSKVIPMPGEILADSKHRWGLLPCHYTQRFYHLLSLEIENYVLETELEEIARSRNGVSVCVWGNYKAKGTVVELERNIREFSYLQFVIGGGKGYTYQQVKVQPFATDPKNLRAFMGYTGSGVFVIQGRFVSDRRFEVTLVEGDVELGIRKIFGYK